MQLVVQQLKVLGEQQRSICEGYEAVGPFVSVRLYKSHNFLQVTTRRFKKPLCTHAPAVEKFPLDRLMVGRYEYLRGTLTPGHINGTKST
jgi:hypothetical protein